MPSSYSQTATERKPQQGIVVGKGDANSLKVLLSSTVEFAASATAVTVKFGSIPSNARVSGLSRVYNDDCATSGAPVMDFGLDQPSNSDVTADPDALGSGTATLATASATGYPIISDVANIGLPAWDLISGLSSDPAGNLDVYGTLTDAATTQAGTVTIQLLGYLD